MGSSVRSLSKTHSTATGTFRLDSELLDALKEEAQQKRTSLNTLVTQVLSLHAEYHSFAAKGGFISMPKTLLMRLMDKLDQQEVIQLSEHIAKNELKDTILLMQGAYTAESIMDFVEAWARAGGYPYRHHTEKGDNGKVKKEHKFVMQHDMGERWSLYFVELFRFAFNQVGVKINFQHTPNTVSFEAEF